MASESQSLTRSPPLFDNYDDVLSDGHTQNVNNMPDSDTEELRPTGRDWRFFNIIILGLAFMLIFTSFQTTSMIEASVLEGARNSSNGTFTGNGYTSLAVVYASFSAANWLAPSIVSVCGPRLSMFAGGITYALFIASFLKPMTWLLYTMSVLIGLGAAVIWTAQGNFLTLNSNDRTMGRNSGIFWALLQCSLLFGNLYVYFAFAGEIIITDHTRTKVYIVLSAVCLIGVLTLLILRKPQTYDTSGILSFSTESESQPKQEKGGALNAFLTSVKLMCTRDMLLLTFTFAYTGFELTFFSGVYTTTVGHNLQFGANVKSLMGLCGMAIGVGEILGGGLFGIFGSKTIKYGRDPIVMFGLVIHLVAFYLIFLTMQSNSPIEDTSDPTYIPSSNYLAIGCGFLLGLGDSSWNTQLFSILGHLYPTDSAPAFACFKFVQSATAAAGFFYSNILALEWQLLILVVLGVIGAGTFCIVEWGSKNRKSSSSFPEI